MVSGSDLCVVCVCFCVCVWVRGLDWRTKKKKRRNLGVGNNVRGDESGKEGSKGAGREEMDATM